MQQMASRQQSIVITWQFMPQIGPCRDSDIGHKGPLGLTMHAHAQGQ